MEEEEEEKEEEEEECEFCFELGRMFAAFMCSCFKCRLKHGWHVSVRQRWICTSKGLRAYVYTMDASLVCMRAYEYLHPFMECGCVCANACLVQPHACMHSLIHVWEWEGGEGEEGMKCMKRGMKRDGGREGRNGR